MSYATKLVSFLLNSSELVSLVGSLFQSWVPLIKSDSCPTVRRNLRCWAGLKIVVCGGPLLVRGLRSHFFPTKCFWVFVTGYDNILFMIMFDFIDKIFRILGQTDPPALALSVVWCLVTIWSRGNIESLLTSKKQYWDFKRSIYRIYRYKETRKKSWIGHNLKSRRDVLGL